MYTHRWYVFDIPSLTVSCIMMKNGQGYFKNLALFTAQDFESMFDHEIFQIESVIFL